VRQIYRICTMYWDDKYGTHSVSAEVCSLFLCHEVQFLASVKSVGYLQVVAKMRDMVSNDTQNPVSNSFLLDDDLRLLSMELQFMNLFVCLSNFHDSCTCLSF
jgi:myosin-5